MSVTIVGVDYNDAQQGADLVWLLNQYAQDPMGGEEALSEHCQKHLAQTLATVPHAFSFIAYVDGKPAGLINCFEAFSTFKCKPLVNIHDLAVVAQYRGLGLSKQLMQAVADEAKNRGCCKLTLEVLSGNDLAKQAYLKFGFEQYTLADGTGHALFMEMPL